MLAGVLLGDAPVTPKRKVDLALVTEDFRAPDESPTREQVEQAWIAAGIREGRRRQRADSADQTKLAGEALSTAQSRIAEITQSHDKHLRATAKASFHQGVTYASVIWLIIAAATGWAGAWLQTTGFSMRVADERIPRAAVPVLEDRYAEPGYERHPREPVDARN